MPRAVLSLSLLFVCAALPAAAQPRLGVLIVFDQLRPDELDRYAPLFGPGGFGGIADKGARYDATYEYAATETGPGHATISTGANPDVHGIVTNRWPKDGALEYAIADKDAKLVGHDGAGYSAKNLGAPTLADAVKEQGQGKAKVITIAIKDRAAVLTGGRSADLALWYDPDAGRFVSSTAYTDKLPEWAASLGEKRPAAARQNGTWEVMATPPKLRDLLPVDDREGEGNPYEMGRVFPHHLKALKDDATKKRAYRGTPQAIADLFALAKVAVTEEKLGQDRATDLLVIGVSPTDYAGHWFGPDSLEYADLLRHADQQVRDLVRFLEKSLGRSVVVGISADHGAPSLPEQLQKDGIDAGRIMGMTLESDLSKACGGKVIIRPPHVFVDGVEGPAEDNAVACVLDKLTAHDQFERVYRRDALGTATGPFVPLMRAVQYPGRSGQIVFRQRAHHVFTWESQDGIDHGSVFLYDRRVPFVLYGPGVRRGRYPDRIDVRDVATSMSYALGVPPPALAQGRPVGALTPPPSLR